MLNPAKLRSRRGRWPVGGGVSVIFHTQARHLHSFPSSWHICVGVNFSFTFRLRRQSHWNVFSFRWGLTTPCPLDLFLIFNCFGSHFFKTPQALHVPYVCARLWWKGPPLRTKRNVFDFAQPNHSQHGVSPKETQIWMTEKLLVFVSVYSVDCSTPILKIILRELSKDLIHPGALN